MRFPQIQNKTSVGLLQTKVNHHFLAAQGDTLPQFTFQQLIQHTRGRSMDGHKPETPKASSKRLSLLKFIAADNLEEESSEEEEEEPQAASLVGLQTAPNEAIDWDAPLRINTEELEQSEGESSLSVCSTVSRLRKRSINSESLVSKKHFNPVAQIVSTIPSLDSVNFQWVFLDLQHPCFFGISDHPQKRLTDLLILYAGEDKKSESLANGLPPQASYNNLSIVDQKESDKPSGSLDSEASQEEQGRIVALVPEGILLVDAALGYGHEGMH